MATIAPEIAETWQKILDEKDSTNWVLAGYPEGKTNEVLLKESGSGGFDEMMTKLGDEIMWGGFRVVGVDDRGNLASRRSKFIFFGYLPKTAKVMARAKCGGHKAAVKESFPSIHVEFMLEEPGEISQEEVIAKLRACGGAHQPTSYEF